MPLQLSIAQAQFLCSNGILLAGILPAGGYSTVSARGRVFYRRIPARWHLEDAIRLTRSLREIRYLFSTNQIARFHYAIVQELGGSSYTFYINYHII